MVTYRNGPPGQGPGGEGERPGGSSLSDPNRVHVTLANLTDLVDLAPGFTDRAPAPAPAPAPDPDRIEHDAFWGRAAPEPAYDQHEGETATVRAGWARPAERWLLELLAVAAASVAFVSPSISLLVVVVGCVVGGMAAFVASGNPLGSLPGRTLRRSWTLLHPRSSLWAPALVSRTVIAAVVLSGGVAAAVWVADEGTDGVAAAARAGAWADGFRVAAALVCAMLLTSVGDGHHHRKRAVRRWAGPATDGTLLILAVSCCAAAVLTIVAVPHPTDPIASRADGLGWLPVGARAFADRVRDDIVTNELNTLASCLSSRSDTSWQPSYSSQNPAGAPDVARFVSARAPSAGVPSDLATVVMAAHNQLAPWVETIEVGWSTGEKVRTERDTLPSRQPLTDTDRLVAATTVGSQWLSGGLPDPSTVLRCSAGPVL